MILTVSTSDFPNSPNPYEVLGVCADASQDEIKAGYRKAQRQAHPDLGGDPAQFDLVTRAWELIGTAEARAEFHRDARTRSPRSAGSSRATGTSATSSTTRQQSSRQTPKPVTVVPSLAQGPVTVQLGKTSVIVDATLVESSVIGRVPTGLFSSGRSGAYAQVASTVAPSLRQALPAARIVLGLKTKELTRHLKNHRRDKARSLLGTNPPPSTQIPMVVLCGYRLACVWLMKASPGVYQWDGERLFAENRPVSLPGDATRSPSALAGLVTLFPELTVGHFVALIPSDQHPFAPDVTSTGPHQTSCGLEDVPANLNNTIRHLKMFLGVDHQHHVLDRNLLGSLVAMSPFPKDRSHPAR
ncbi:hypothetical protein DCC24_03770 [Auritidibacter sp. NML100628]|nr:hypothetical protein DCC24_03770 [Auritidibacter sp. NML100628]